MKIDHYSFGNISVDGKPYTSDVIIFPDRVQSSWWRREGHLLQADDLEDILAEGIPVLIVGTGYYGSMKVPDKVLKFLSIKDVEVFVKKTGDAVILFNEMVSQKPAIAALHLTC
ncbi:MAG: Mth938-like domain-containing protein [Planctomycetota bacterium]|jgi:hypothetical protein